MLACGVFISYFWWDAYARTKENHRKTTKQLRKDTYNNIRELQKELQKINPSYQPGDGALQWREARRDFAEYTTVQLQELEKEMRKVNPEYKSSQKAPRDEDAKGKSGEDALHELQRAFRKMNPDYEPGQGARLMWVVLQQELCAISRAVMKSSRPPVKCRTEPPIKPDINSEDAVESLAAKLQDPELRQHYRSAWDYYGTQWYKKDEIREMVDDHMSIFGIKWPKEGNPFGTDDDDEI
ncbi:MAG: hypothetical protein Q9208_001572 [Pyrenodesmia sp. 3 TL-2023]